MLFGFDLKQNLEISKLRIVLTIYVHISKIVHLYFVLVGLLIFYPLRGNDGWSAKKYENGPRNLKRNTQKIVQI